MRSERPGPRVPGLPTRRAGVPVLLTAALLTASCGTSGGGSDDESGPPRLSPAPRHDVAAAMIEGQSAPSRRLDACRLLGLSTARVAELTDTDLPGVEPTGTGDLGDVCTYGGPGSRERLAAEGSTSATTTAATPTAEAADAEAEAETTDTTGTPTATTGPGTSPSTTEDEDSPDDGDTDAGAADEEVPDTVAAGVVKPRAGARAALAGQAALLGARYACSEVRGEGAGEVAGAAPAAPGAPRAVRPEPPSVYIDCVASPAGGGTEVHTIFVADNDLWHIAVVRPGTPRSAAAESEALAGAHRLADEILG